MVSALSGVCEVSAAGELRIVRYVAALADAVGPLSLAALAALAPALVREGVRAVIASTPYGDEGPPMRARAALVAEVDGKIAALVTEHAALVDNAGALGITLADLPATVGRRAQAAQAHERWELDQVANRAYYKQSPEREPARAGGRAVSGEIRVTPPSRGDVLLAARAFNWPAAPGRGPQHSPGEHAWRGYVTEATAAEVWEALRAADLNAGDADARDRRDDREDDDEDGAG